MKFCIATCCVALVLGLSAPQAMACDGVACKATASSKPLDLKKFMREQAASTRTPEAMRATRPKGAHHPLNRRATVRLRSKQVPVEAASAYAAQGDPGVAVPGDPTVELVTSDEFNAIDRRADAAAIATAAPIETVGAAASAPIVQVVDAGEINDIDRKAEIAPVSARTTSEPAGNTDRSWARWLWSSFTDGLGAFAAAVRHLFS